METLCSTISRVRFLLAFTRTRASDSSCVSWALSPLKTSSTRRTSGKVERARASSTFFNSPWERFRVSESGARVRPTS